MRSCRMSAGRLDSMAWNRASSRSRSVGPRRPSLGVVVVAAESPSGVRPVASVDIAEPSSHEVGKSSLLPVLAVALLAHLGRTLTTTTLATWCVVPRLGRCHVVTTNAPTVNLDPPRLDPRGAHPAQNVRALRDGLEVIRIDATGVSAQVVDNQRGVDLASVCEFPGQTVCGASVVPEVEHPVAVPKRTSPSPTALILEDVAVEALDERGGH